MSKDATETAVEVLGRTYHVKCQRNEISALSQAAKQLEDRLRLVRESNHAIDSSRIVMITALNIMHELMAVTQEKNHYSQQVMQKLQYLDNKISDTFLRFSQMELGSAEEA